MFFLLILTHKNFIMKKYLFFFIALIIVSLAKAQPNKQYSKLFASDFAGSDLFGCSVAISDTLCVVGAKGKNTNSGAAYVFMKNGNNYSQLTKIISSDDSNYDYFGAAVDINDTNIIVGSPNKDSYQGRAYIYSYENGTWNEQILAPTLDNYDRFGTAVSICDSFAVVSAPYDDDAASNSGAVYLYNYNESSKTWDFQTKIIAPDAEASEYFGSSLSITNKYLFVGANEYSGGGTNLGKVYIFKYSSTSWIQDGFLRGDSVDNARFGNSIAVFDSTVVVGANTETNTNGTSAGNAYIFEKTSAWNRIAKLQASKGSADDNFGTAVDIYDKTVVVSAPSYSESGITPGAAYVYFDSLGTWTERAMLRADTVGDGDAFGAGVALSKDNLFVGASNNDRAATDAGVVYLFVPRPVLWQKSQNLLNQCSNSSGNFIFTGYNIDSIQWQISQNNSAFTNIDNNIQYSGVNTNDLNIIYEMSIDSASFRAMLFNKYFQIPTDTVILTFEKNNPVPDLTQLDTIFGQCSASVTNYPTATDECESSIIATTDSALTYSEQGKDTIVWIYTDPNGNITKQNQIVIIHDTIAPAVSCSADTNFVMANSQGEYIVSGNEFVPDFTDNCSSITISNDYNNQSSLNGVNIGLDTINVNWTATDAAGNSSHCQTIIAVREYQVAIDEHSLTVQMYPNPAKDFIHLNLPANDEVYVKIFNSEGKLVYSDNFSSSIHQIDVHNFNQGLYYVQLRSEKKLAYKKIIIQK